MPSSSEIVVYLHADRSMTLDSGVPYTMTGHEFSVVSGARPRQITTRISRGYIVDAHEHPFFVDVLDAVTGILCRLGGEALARADIRRVPPPGDRYTWAPWSDAEVAALNRYQSGPAHPFTCATCRDEAVSQRRFDDTSKRHDPIPDFALVATPDGWRCGGCGRWQGWAHAHMLDLGARWLGMDRAGGTWDGVERRLRP